MGLTNGFTTAEENYCAVVGFLTQLYPHVIDTQAKISMLEIMREMVGIYPHIFKLDIVNGFPTITVIEEKVNEA